jgi:hypothetical protein
MVIRQPCKDVERRQRRVYALMLAGLAVLLSIMRGVALFRSTRLENTKQRAKEACYDTTQLKLRIGALEAGVERFHRHR